MARRPLTDKERYQRLAEKRNLRAGQNHPLFAHAGLLHEVARIWTAEDVRREIEGYAAKLEQTGKEMLQRAQRLREEFGVLAGPEELAKADAYWQARVERWGDKGPAYECEYWRGLLRDWRLRDAPVRVAAYGYRNAFGQLVVVTDLYSGGQKWVPSVFDVRRGIWEPWLLGCGGGWPTHEEAQAELDKAAEAARWERAEVKTREEEVGVANHVHREDAEMAGR